MKALLCISAIILGARLGARGAESVDYLREIKPLLRARCYACHGALKQKDQLRLDTGEAIRRGGKHGPVILTNDVAKSPLLLRVTSTNSDERMPAEGEALTPEQVARLRNWIAQGAPSPADEKPEPDPRQHWAFQAPRRPRVPPIAHRPSPIANPVDAFIVAEQFAEQFDAPNPTECYRRTQTIIPQQALALTNGKLSHECSRALAQRLAQNFVHATDIDEEDFITAAYEQVLTRRPTDEELAACRDFLAKGSPKGDDSARASLIHVLLNHNDFLTIR